MSIGIGHDGAGIDPGVDRLGFSDNTQMPRQRAQGLIQDIARHLSIPMHPAQMGNGNGEADSGSLQSLLTSLRNLAQQQPDAVMNALAERPDVAKALFGAMPPSATPTVNRDIVGP